MVVSLLSNAALGNVSNPTTNVSLSVVLPAGTNRRLLVAVGQKYFNNVDPLPPSSTIAPTVTYQGVPLQELTRATDGVTGAFLNRDVTSFFSRNGIYWSGLREADFAGMSGSGTLSCTLAPGTSVWQFTCAYWFLGNVDQGDQIRYFGRFSASSAATTLAGTLLPGGTSDAVLLAGINGTSSGSIQMTVNSVGLTEDFDQSFVALGARFAGANVLSGVPVPTFPIDMTYTAPAANSRSAVLVGLRIAEFFPVNPGNAVIYGGPGSVVSLEAS